MKTVTVVLAFLCWCVTTSAVAEVERSLNKSPDGKFEVILTAETERDLGRVEVRDLSSGKAIATPTGQGYGAFPNEDVKVQWRADSNAFAVSYRGTRTTYHTDVYVRSGEQWEKLDEPPYAANILGRQGVLKRDRYFTQNFGGFMEESRFTIICTIKPDQRQKQAAAKFERWKPSDETEWKVVLQYQPGQRPNCEVVSIEEARENAQKETKEPAMQR